MYCTMLLSNFHELFTQLLLCEKIWIPSRYTRNVNENALFRNASADRMYNLAAIASRIHSSDASLCRTTRSNHMRAPLVWKFKKYIYVYINLYMKWTSTLVGVNIEICKKRTITINEVKNTNYRRSCAIGVEPAGPLPAVTLLKHAAVFL